MGVTVRFREWVPGCAVGPASEVELPSRRATLRSLIERRVLRELEAQALVETARPQDGKRAVAAALAAFTAGKLLVLTPTAQLHELDAWVELRPGDELTFLQLRPLVSG